MHLTRTLQPTAFLLLAAALTSFQLLADESQATQDLTSKGAKITDTKGVLSLDAPDIAKWADADFKELTQLSHLQKVSFGRGLTDAQLALFTSVPSLTAFTTNGAELSDAGVKALSSFKKLQVLTFFHPGKTMTGTGFADLAALPSLENLTVAGSGTFGNEGVAAVAKLSHLKSLRIFHTNADMAGLSKLSALTGLTNLTLGQRLSYTPPAALTDETLSLIVSFKSLEALGLSEARLSFSALRQLKQLSHLKHLTLDVIEITGGDVEQLKQALPGVQIKFTAPTEANLKRIKALFGA